jgi:hypothetical protein
MRHIVYVNEEIAPWTLTKEYRAICTHPRCNWTEKAVDRETAELRAKRHEMRPHHDRGQLSDGL